MRATAALIALSFAAGCSDGQSNPIGTSEPFRVQKAQFFSGALPGSPPDSGMYMPGDPPRITDMMVTGTLVAQGTGGKKLPGHGSQNAYSIGLAAEGLGTGWWMIGAGDEDTSQTLPRVAFTAIADFAADLRPGPLPIRLVALDREGNAGAQFREPLCVTSTGPVGDSMCADGKPLPAAAITLTWDTQVDLDLQVVTPDGRIVGSKHPSLHPPEKGDDSDPSLKPHMDRDSNANCVIDGVRSESLLWPTLTPDQGETELPEDGIYQIYVNLFDPCGQQAVHFHVKITTAVPSDDGAGGASGEQDLVEHQWLDVSGELIASQATPADPKGLFVSEFTFP